MGWFMAQEVLSNPTPTSGDETLQMIRVAYEAGKGAVVVEVWIGALIVLVLAIGAYVLLTRVAWFRRNVMRWEPVECNVGSDGTSVKFEVDRVESNIFIAHRILVELETRKAAIEVEPERDVIVEVYNSWYQLFQAIREEIKSVPAKYLRRQDTRRLLDLSKTILNDVMRPHLTEYQADFRRWYDAEKAQPSSSRLSPQQIQESYPRFGELITDMRRVNVILRGYVKELRKLVS